MSGVPIPMKAQDSAVIDFFLEGEIPLRREISHYRPAGNRQRTLHLK
jgi:hypothetical protein